MCSAAMRRRRVVLDLVIIVSLVGLIHSLSGGLLDNLCSALQPLGHGGDLRTVRLYA